jgi:hypothetical protein
VFTAFARSNGTAAWSRLGEVKAELSSPLYVGLAVTAHNDDRLGSATFDQVSVKARPD